MDSQQTPAYAKDERIALYVQKVLADAPPLTDEQKDRIGYLLSRGGARRG